MKKRLLSILTLLTMAVSLFSPVVLAQGNLSEDTDNQTESVEEVAQEEDIKDTELESSKAKDDELEKEAVVELRDLTIHDKDGNEIKKDDELIVKDLEEVQIKAKGLANKDYQWQIFNPESTEENDKWIDIKDETEETLKISYTLIKSLLIEDATKIRVRSAEDKEHFSESIIVRFTDEVEATEGNTFNKVEDVNESLISYLNQLPDINDSEPDIYGFSVQTYYINEDGEEVKLPSIIEGQLNITDDGLYEATAEIPEVDGYEADLDNISIEGTEDKNVIRITEDKKNIELKIDNLTRDLIIKIKYIPTEVKFTVEHYQQNVADDEYTKHREFEITEHKTGTSIETIKDEVDSLTTIYEGFYQLPYNNKVKIAADGSTTIQIKYDRDYSLINFVLGQGGYGVEPIYGRYDATIDPLSNPVRPGYEFVGWTTSEADFNAVEKGDKNPNNVNSVGIEEKMPATDVTYYGLWNPVKVNYTVMYWYQNANPNDDGEYGYSFLAQEQGAEKVKHGQLVTEQFIITGTERQRNPDWTLFNEEPFWIYVDIKIPFIEEYINKKNGIFSAQKIESRHFTYNKETTDIANKDVEFAPDGSTVINIYYDRNTYDLIFNLNGGRLSKNGQIYTGSQYKITAKYEEDIGDRWPMNKDIPSRTLYSWDGGKTTSQSNVSKRHNLTDDLIRNNQTTFIAQYRTDTKTINLNYYVESLEQTSGDNKRWYVDRYYEISDKYSQEAQEPFNSTWNHREILGLDIVNKDAVKPRGTNDVNFYYNRKKYPLYINNYFEGHYIDKAGKSIEKKDVKEIKYGQNIKEEEPNLKKIGYPEGLEKNAYEIDREKPLITKDGPNKIAFNFDTEMSNRPLNVYVNWVRKKYDLNFYDSNDMADRVQLNDSAFEIEHGSSIKDNEQEIIKNKLEELKSNKYDGYKFVGWFYEKELRYDDGTPKLDEDGNPKFEEKAYDFNIPLTQDIDVYAKWTSNVLKEYNVQYLYNKRDDKGELIQQIPIAKPIVGQYKFAGETHTENVKTGRQLNEGYRSGYFPTKLSQSLTISKDGEITDDGEILSGDNVITFEYEKEDTLDYLVRYLLEDENGKLVKDNDGNYIPLIKTKNNIKYYLDAAREKYISGNGDLHSLNDTTLSEYIKEAETSKDVITERPERAPGYKPDSYTKRLILRFFEKDEENPNEIIFRYQSTDKALVNIRYFKENSNGSEVLGNKKYSEFGDEKNLEIDYNSTETFELTKHLLKLEGFMLSTVTSFGEKVDKVEDNWMLDIDKKGLEIKIYYDYENTDLTITKEVTGKIDENQTFVFNVKGDDKNTENIELTVTIHGKDKREVTIKDLPIGEYIVTEQTDWSWRYTPEGEDEIVKAISVGGDNLFEFINKRTNNKWLSGDSYKENKFD